MSVVVAMGKFTKVQTEYAIRESLPRNATTITAQIVVGTPGTMADLMRRKVRFGLEHRQKLISLHINIVGSRCQRHKGIRS